MGKYSAGGFDLVVDKNKAKLFYNEEVVLENRNEILQLTLDLGLEDTAMIAHLDIEEEE